MHKPYESGERSSALSLERVSDPSPIAINILMVRNGKGQSSHVPVFCVNLGTLGNYFIYSNNFKK